MFAMKNAMIRSNIGTLYQQRNMKYRKQNRIKKILLVLLIHIILKELC